jgi:hypothetical protein
MTSARGVPIATSATPWRRSAPLSVQMTVPGDSAVPTDRNHSAPSASNGGMLAIVSTLLASVGGAGDPTGPAIAVPAGSSGVGPTSSTPCRNGGAMRGNGGLPSSTSSSPVSSPNRYSPGPRATAIVMPGIQSVSRISAMADSSRSFSSRNVSLMATITRSAPTAEAAISAPSMTA